MNNEVHLCECGCGGIVKTVGHRYYPGHVRIGKHYSGKWMKCAYCLKDIWISESIIRKGSKNIFCSRKCHYSFRCGKFVGNLNPNWKGGRVLIRGRYAIFLPDHPRATKEGYVYEQIPIAEKVLHRHLKYIGQGHYLNEVVHHVDENKSNNANSNFLICQEWFHRYLHAKIRERRRLCLPI